MSIFKRLVAKELLYDEEQTTHWIVSNLCYLLYTITGEVIQERLTFSINKLDNLQVEQGFLLKTYPKLKIVINQTLLTKPVVQVNI